MKQTKIWLFFLILFGAAFAGCKKTDDITTQIIHLNIIGLEDLGPNFRYEGWIIVNGAAVTTGTFTVDAAGAISQKTWTIDKAQLAAATDFVLTIEPFPDANPAPTATHILAGSFVGSTATIGIADAKALGNDFATAWGKYILATPTNGPATNEKSGIWFLDLSSGSPMQGLNLPTLPPGWVYEGWAVIGGKPVTSGRFTSAKGVDMSAPYSSTMMPGPPFPGEDYLMNAPAGFTFPTDLSGGTAVISIEPEPDNSPAPFTLKPLVGSIPAAAMDHTTYSMNQSSASFPAGIITR